MTAVCDWPGCWYYCGETCDNVMTATQCLDAGSQVDMHPEESQERLDYFA